MTKGDDLAQARRFADLCQDAMTSLMKCTHPFDSEALLMLESIESQAKHMKARAISRTAKLAIDDLSAAKAGRRSLGSLLALNKLVRQYIEGLDEIAPRNAPVSKNSDIFQEKLQALLMTQEAEMVAAQETAHSLLFLARPGKERENIRALTRISQLGYERHESQTTDTFDTIMPTVTNEALRRARRGLKSVSVSYATDDFAIEPHLTKILRSAIVTLCEELVDRCVEAPLRRKNLGLSGAAHIAITAKRRQNMFDILISCEGPAPMAGLLETSPIEALRSFGASSHMMESKGLTRIEIKNLPVAETAKTHGVLGFEHPRPQKHMEKLA